MADELNTPNHRYHQRRYNVRLAPNEVSRRIIRASGIVKIDRAAIAPLFAGGEVGVWYDPSDLTTLFQDSAGATPVTAAGQPVGLMLDKSKGLTLGGDLRSTATVGLVGSAAVASFSPSTGAGSVSRTAFPADQSFVQFSGLVAEAFYEMRFSAPRANAITIRSGDQAATPWFDFFTGNVAIIRASAGGLITITASANSTSTFTMLSVKLLAGNHATRSTSAQRPTYGIHPYSGVRNLQVQTEDFSSSRWTKNTCTVSVPSVPAPARGGVYGRVTSTGSYAALRSQFVFAPLTQYTVSGVVKRVSSSQMSIVVEGAGNPNAVLTFATGVFTRNFCTGTVTAIDADTYFLTITFTTPAVTTGFAINWWVGIYSGVSTAGQAFDLSAPQIELGATATAYQKVVTQYEVTEAGVPSVHYIGFDGLDDNMKTSSIDFTATNKMTAFAGVRKLSDATRGLVFERGSGVGGTNINAPSGAFQNYVFTSSGGQAIYQNVAVAAPNTSVITGVGSILDDVSVMRINGTQVGTSSTDQGTGNYSNDILYIGSRGGTSLYFNGNIYSLIVRGAESTAGQITSTETWVNGKTGAY